MKDVFYFTLKILFILKIFKFLSWTFGHAEKQLDLINQANFKIYEVTTWEKTIAMHILANISRNKDNQTMKLGQLIEYNMRNIFLEKLYSKCRGETIPRPFSKNSKLSIYLFQ